jgi:hypothetical protein
VAIADYYVDPLSGNDTTGDGLSDGTAWQTVQKALDTITQGTDGDRINIKDSATETLTAALDTATNYGTPTTAKPLVFQGYSSTQGDGGRFDINCGGSNGLFATINLNYVMLKDGHVRNSGSNKLIDCTSYVTLLNMEISDCTGTATIDFNGNGNVIVGCYIHDTHTSGICMDLASDNVIAYNRIKTSRATAIDISSFQNVVLGNTITCAGSSTNGVRCGGGTPCFYNTIYNSASGTGYGIKLDHANPTGAAAINNIIMGFSGAGGYGIICDDPVCFLAGNRFYNNTNNVTAGVLTEIDSVTLGADPFTDAANEDFSISTTTDIEDEAYPDYVGGGASTATQTYGTIGAAKLSSAGGGGGSTVIIHGSTNGGMQ